MCVRDGEAPARWRGPPQWRQGVSHVSRFHSNTDPVHLLTTLTHLTMSQTRPAALPPPSLPGPIWTFFFGRPLALSRSRSSTPILRPKPVKLAGLSSTSRAMAPIVEPPASKHPREPSRLSPDLTGLACPPPPRRDGPRVEPNLPSSEVQPSSHEAENGLIK